MVLYVSRCCVATSAGAATARVCVCVWWVTLLRSLCVRVCQFPAKSLHRLFGCLRVVRAVLGVLRCVFELELCFFACFACLVFDRAMVSHWQVVCDYVEIE